MQLVLPTIAGRRPMSGNIILPGKAGGAGGAGGGLPGMGGSQSSRRLSLRLPPRISIGQGGAVSVMQLPVGGGMGGATGGMGGMVGGGFPGPTTPTKAVSPTPKGPPGGAGAPKGPAVGAGAPTPPVKSSMTINVTASGSPAMLGGGLPAIGANGLPLGGAPPGGGAPTAPKAIP